MVLRTAVVFINSVFAIFNLSKVGNDVKIMLKPNNVITQGLRTHDKKKGWKKAKKKRLKTYFFYLFFVDFSWVGLGWVGLAADCHVRRFQY